jgi:hypothetical protein
MSWKNGHRIQKSDYPYVFSGPDITSNTFHCYVGLDVADILQKSLLESYPALGEAITRGWSKRNRVINFTSASWPKL